MAEMKQQEHRPSDHPAAPAPLARIAITGMVVPCVIGVYPHEKNEPQPLLVDLAVDVAAATLRDELADTMDYAALTEDVKFVLEHGRFHLIETAAAALLGYLLAPLAGVRPLVKRATVTLCKPLALGQNGPRASVTLQGAEDGLVFATHRLPHARVTTLFQNKRLTLLAAALPPGQTTPAFTHSTAQVLEKPSSFSPDIWVGKPGSDPVCASGSLAEFMPGHKRYYRNSATTTGMLLAMVRGAEGISGWE